MSNLTGFERVLKVAFMGEWRSPHTLTIEIYTDFNEKTPYDVVTMDNSTGYSIGDPLTFRHHIGLKIKAIKFRIYDTNQSGTGESFKASQLALEYRIKTGLRALPAAKTI
jgi:hypothetical protein